MISFHGHRCRSTFACWEPPTHRTYRETLNKIAFLVPFSSFSQIKTVHFSQQRRIKISRGEFEKYAADMAGIPILGSRNKSNNINEPFIVQSSWNSVEAGTYCNAVLKCTYFW